jgi:hypothetical protein
MSGGEARDRIRMQNTRNWNPAVHQPVQPIERNAAALAAA